MLRCLWLSNTKSQISHLILGSRVGDTLLPLVDGDAAEVDVEEQDGEELRCVERGLCWVTIVGDLGELCT